MTAGTKFGPYEVVSALGAGGMGEVYRCRDTRLRREVALKLLPADLADDPERRQRFEHEARAAGALNHPNLVAVYDVGEQDGIPYIVSELVDGESLRALLRKSERAPLRKLLDISVQVAGGMAVLHEAGLVHRDLKPENIMVTPKGVAKILDFGLAKANPFQRAASTDHDATVTISQTRPNLVMGTVGYMSPEQVRGLDVDHRSDIFSFGAVLFEMFSGKRPFSADSQVEILSAILKDEPPELPASVPKSVQSIVAHCLEKDPNSRFQSARDLAFSLRAIADPHPSAVTSSVQLLDASASERQTRKRLAMWLAAGLACAVLAAFLWIRPQATDLSRYRYTPFETTAEAESAAAWSPDGRSIAFVKPVQGVKQIFLRSLDSPSPVQLTHLEKSTDVELPVPFWSPDGTRIYFIWRRGVWSVGRAGGEPEKILDEALAAAISPDGGALAVWRRWYVNGTKGSSLCISSPPGHEPREYNPAPFRVLGSYLGPHVRFSPDGRWILAGFGTAHGSEAWIMPYPDGPAAKPRKLLSRNTIFAQYPPSFGWMPDSRHAVIPLITDMGFKNQHLWLTDTVTEDAYPLTSGPYVATEPAVSHDGRRVVFTLSNRDYDIVQVPVDGSAIRPLVATSRNEHSAAWSSTDKYVYVTDRAGPEEIWLKNVQDGIERPAVTARDFPNDTTQSFTSPMFSPDGSRIAYTRLPVTGPPANWISPVSGGVPTRITDFRYPEHTPAWSPDGKWITFLGETNGDLALFKVRVGSRESPMELYPKMCSGGPQWSPAGTWISCARADEGMSLVNAEDKSVRPLAPQWSPVSHVWSRDGSTIYGIANVEGAWKLSSVNVATGKVRTIADVGAASDLRFETPRNPGLVFSLTPDGKSFAASVLMVKSDLWLLEGFPQPGGWLSRLKFWQ